MTRHDDAAELIERARRALSPREGDQARVLAALDARLFTPPPAQQLTAAGSRARSLHRSAWLWKGLLPLALVGVIGLMVSRTSQPARPREGASSAAPALATVVQSLSALPVGVPDDAKPQEHAVPAALATGEPAPGRATPPATNGPAPSGAASLATGGPAPSRAASPATNGLATGDPAPRRVAPPATGGAAPKPERKKPARKKCRAADGGERPCPSPAAPTALAMAESDDPGEPAGSSLRLELEALRGAERALRERQPAAALALLEDLERTLSGGGLMREERFAAATMARCALDANAGPTLLQHFTHHFPSSAYAARVRQGCSR